MNNILFQYKCAFGEVFADNKYLALFGVLTTFFFSLFIYIPTSSIPGNTLKLQLATFDTNEYALMIALAVLIGLTFTFQWYSFRRAKRDGVEGSKALASTTVSGISGIFGAVVGTAFCAACLIPLFALLGLSAGTVFFVLENQLYFLILSVLAMITSFYFAVRRVNKIFKTC
ncbi:MAG: hypothetical protein ACE5DQ_02935 [Candidatus Paceibacterota bacterium]